MSGHTQIKLLLEQAAGGSQGALDLLMPLVYEDLRDLAHFALRHESGANSLHTTVLAHEAYLTLARERTAWEGPSHVLGIAATTMRRFLVNRAEAARRVKRGGAHVRVSLEEAEQRPAEAVPELIEVDGALERLARVDERKARLVELRFFAGFTLQEAARVLGVSLNTAKRDWALAKLWILNDIQESRQRGS